MPPVLYVALFELVRGGAQKLRARHIGPRVDGRHHVLQLIAEAVSAARLIKGRARPHATGQSLTEQPAIQQRIQRRVGRVHLDGLKHLIPTCDDPLEGFVDGVRLTETRDYFLRLTAARARAEQEEKLAPFARRKLDLHLQSRARIEARAAAPRESCA